MEIKSLWISLFNLQAVFGPKGHKETPWVTAFEVDAPLKLWPLNIVVSILPKDKNTINRIMSGSFVSSLVMRRLLIGFKTCQ